MTRPTKHSSCSWCGVELVQSGRGRPRKFCSPACRQRAYEQRHNVLGSAIPVDAVIIHPDKADALRDQLYMLRCSAEDIATAVSEGADSNEIRGLAGELVALARKIEKMR